MQQHLLLFYNNKMNFFGFDCEDRSPMGRKLNILSVVLYDIHVMSQYRSADHLTILQCALNLNAKKEKWREERAHECRRARKCSCQDADLMVYFQVRLKHASPLSSGNVPCAGLAPRGTIATPSAGRNIHLLAWELQTDSSPDWEQLPTPSFPNLPP